MLRVCEKLRQADAKGKRYGLARAETSYLRVLVDAMADMDRLAEVELLKSLGDVNLEKGRHRKAVEEFKRALTLYTTALVQCDHREQEESIKHRYEYTKRLLQGVSSKGSPGIKEHTTEDMETTTPAKVADMFQDLDRKRDTGGNTHSVLVGYAQLMVEGIVNGNNMLETEAVKSLGDVYLKRGTETKATSCLTKATALYNTALARCHKEQVIVVLVHRLLHTAKLRQDMYISRTKTKRSEHTQRQQDVRRREGHFSSLPISDIVNDGMHQPQISYHRYIQTADSDLANGDLDAAEQNIAAALKLVHDPGKPDKVREADCLCRLGDVYVERGKRTGEGRKFTQAAALYNASMARTDGDKQIMITRLQETERQFLRNTCNIDCEPCPYSNALEHKKQLDNMRVRVKSQLDTIHHEHNPYQYDEDDPVVREVEIKRAEAIKSLFKRITIERQEFIQLLTDECIAKLGAPPCKYAFIGLGSQATELVTPYSDLEFAILIEDGNDDDDTRWYFLNLTHYLHLKVINLGETILPAMAIPSLNDFLSEDPEKDWFFDSVTTRGFAFDGFMPWASKTPFGRDETQSKHSISLIQTPANLAEYQNFHIALAEGYHLSDILRRVSYLTGDEALVDEYTDRVNNSIHHSPLLSRLSATLILKNDARQIENVEPTEQLLNVKKEIYRFPSVAVDVLSICCGITIPSVWRMIEELHKAQRIGKEDAHHLTVLISISAELRLRTYIANGEQKDRLSPLTEMETFLDTHDADSAHVESVFYIPDSKMLFRYYYTAFPLKRYIMGTVVNERPTTKLFQQDIFDSSSLTRGRITQQLFHLNASMRHFTAALEEAGSDEKKQFEILFEIGEVLKQRGDYEKAMGYYKRALRVGHSIKEDSKVLRSCKSSILNSIGGCFDHLGDERKAISYYEQALKMKQAIYGETTPHPDIASVQSNIGSCLTNLGDHSGAISYQEQALQMLTASYGDTAHPDIASAFNNIGTCWSSLGDQRKAISYYEQSLKMWKAIYGDNTAHPDIAISLNNIGNRLSILGDQRKAISYFEHSLKMWKAIYGERAKHPYIAESFNGIGTCWSELGDQRKALIYYEHSLNMRKALYGESKAHPDIAESLNNIGNRWSDLGDQKKAIRYCEQSLEMWKAIYGETTAHADIASPLNNIGTFWSLLGDHTKALGYFEQALEMWKAIYGDTTEHYYIAASLNNIGKCWSELGGKRKAMRYYKQALKMRKAIYGETTPNPEIASSLNNIGSCSSKLGDHKKALMYYEQSLKMRKAIYGEGTAHPYIASSLDNIGTCWSELGDQRKALMYCEQSLKMRKAIFETTAHPDIAQTLNNIGACWCKLGDQRKAVKFYEQSLEIMKIIYSDDMAHPNIASVLENIGLLKRCSPQE
ncbi:uncharacterized protein LOC144864614 [Branchiostoma floridae x Branchiostoma japonicum]